MGVGQSTPQGGPPNALPNPLDPLMGSKGRSKSSMMVPPVEHSMVFKEYDPDKKVTREYTVINQLGKGAFGTVYKVKDKQGDMYALKYMPTLDSDRVKEADMLPKLEHDRIVKYYRNFRYITPNQVAHCLVMEYVEGPTLYEFLAKLRRPLPKHIIMDWFIKFLEVLKYMHSQKIVHRDLKPENIIVTFKNNTLDFKLVDFGLAVHSQATDQLFTVGGTFPYMAPEFFSNGEKRQAYSGKSDMWSLGCILFETVTLDNSFTHELMGMSEKLKANSSYLSAVQDKSIEEILGYMLVTLPSRFSSENLLDDPAIKGWRAALNENDESRSLLPRTTSFVRPFISTIFDKNGKVLARQNLSYLISHLEAPDFQRALLSMRIVEILLQLVEHPTTDGIEDLQQLLHFLKQLEDGSNPTSLALKALQMLVMGTFSDLAVIQILAYPRAIDILIERINSPGVGLLLVALLHTRIGCNILMKTYNIEFVIHNLMQGEKKSAATAVFEDLPLISNHELITLFLSKSQNTTSISDFLRNHKDIQDYVSDKSSSRLQTAVVNAFNEVQKGAESGLAKRFMSGIRNLVMPFPEVLTKECAHFGVCTGYFTGINRTRQIGALCKSCAALVCLPCAKMCHANCTLQVYTDSTIGCSCFNIKEKKCLCGSGSPQNCVPDGILENTAVFDISPPPFNEKNISYYWPNSNIAKFASSGSCVYANGYQFKLGTPAYYEAEIVNWPVGSNSNIGLGLSKAGYLNHHVGWEMGEWGYHGDDGKCFSSSGVGVIFGPTYATGDVIGCGIMSNGHVFFTLNGVYLGKCGDVPVLEESTLFAAASTTGYGGVIKFNFSGPFVFQPPTNPNYIRDFYPSMHLRYNHKALEIAFGGVPADKFMDVLYGLANKSSNLDLVAQLIHAMCVYNPSNYNLAMNAIKRISGSSSSCALKLVEELKRIIIPEVINGSAALKFPINKNKVNQSQDNIITSKTHTSLMSSVPFASKEILDAPSTPTTNSPQSEHRHLSESNLNQSNSLSNINMTDLQALVQQIVLQNNPQSATLSAPPNLLTLLARTSEDEEDDWFELVLEPEARKTMAGLKSAFLLLRHDLGRETEIKRVDKLTNGNKVQLRADSSVAVLKENDKLIFTIIDKSSIPLSL